MPSKRPSSNARSDQPQAATAGRGRSVFEPSAVVDQGMSVRNLLDAAFALPAAPATRDSGLTFTSLTSGAW